MAVSRKTTKSPIGIKIAASSKNKETSSAIQPPFKLEILSKKTKYMIIGALLVVVLGVILYLNRSVFIAVLVNGKPISRLSVVSELEKQYGNDVLNRLIDKSLIAQEAQSKNIIVTDEDINNKRKELVDQFSAGNEENFKQILQAQGISEDEFREELRVQILAEKILGDKIKVTDGEFEQFVNDNPDLLKDAENEGEARKQLRDQLVQQKIQSEFAKFRDELRAKANIQTLVNY